MTTAVANDISTLPSKPGIYHGLSFIQYEMIDAVNNSKFALFDRSPAHAQYAITHPEEASDEMTLGTATHKAILEPAAFVTDYVVAPKVDKRTNVGKAKWAEFEAENRDKEWIEESDYAIAKGMMESAYRHPVLAEALRGPGQNEVTILWTDKTTGLLCKGRIDRFCQVAGFSAILDLKTTRDARPRPFSKSVAQYGYHRQAAFYMDGLDSLSGKSFPRKHYIGAIESEPPHGVMVYEIDFESVEQGRTEYRRALDAYAKCKKSGVWPAYPNTVHELRLPNWAMEGGNVA